MNLLNVFTLMNEYEAFEMDVSELLNEALFHGITVDETVLVKGMINYTSI